MAEFIELFEAHEARVLIPSLSPGSFVVRFGEAGLRRITVRFDSAKPAALFVIRRSIRDSGLAEYVALIFLLLKKSAGGDLADFFPLKTR